MTRKRYKPEEIVAKLRQVDVLVSQGQNMVDAIRQIGVSEVTYYRWRQEFGGLKSEQVKRLKRKNGHILSACLAWMALLLLKKRMRIIPADGSIENISKISHVRKIRKRKAILEKDKSYHQDENPHPHNEYRCAVSGNRGSAH